MIHNLTIDEELLESVAAGKNCHLARNPELTRILEERFGRTNLCLKIFEKPIWSGVLLDEATKVQNVFSWYGLAPRVYAIATIGDRVAQVEDYVEGTGPKRVRKAQDIAKRYHLAVKDGEIDKQLAESHRWINGKIVDFGRFYFASPKWYEKKLREHLYRYHKKPHKESVGYHPCPELGVSGRREIESRVERMGWGDFTGKTVLDIGCNSGAFCWEAAKRGAKRVIGVDHKFAGGNRQLANWLGYWNIDFLELTLPGEWRKIMEMGIDEFDVVICLSIVGHAGGYNFWIPKLCKDLIYFSGQGKEPRDKYQRFLDRDFKKVEWLGYVTDNGKHPLWRCWKDVEKVLLDAEKDD